MVPRRIEAYSNQPVFAFLGQAHVARDACGNGSAPGKFLDSHSHARLQGLGQSNSTSKWIDQNGVATRRESDCRIETRQAQRNLRSNSGSVPSLNQVGHIREEVLILSDRRSLRFPFTRT